MNRIGIDALSVFGLPPVDYVNLAADLGCPTVSMGMAGVGPNLSESPPWTLHDPALRAETGKALRDRGVTIALAEGFVILPNKNARDFAADLDAMAELGAERISTLAIAVDKRKALDELAELAGMAAKVGIRPVIEFVPIFTLATLANALEALRHIGDGRSGLLVDCMHLNRSGASADDLSAIDPELIGYLQLCDAPLVPSDPDYMHEAMYDRKIPGEGELPLLDILRAVPRDCPIGLEIPLEARLRAGEDARQRMSACLAAARGLVDQL